MEGNVLARTQSKASRVEATLTDYVVRHNPLLCFWLVKINLPEKGREGWKTNYCDDALKKDKYICLQNGIYMLFLAVIR